MIAKFARMLGQPSSKAPQSDHAFTRRSLVSRVLQTSAGALVAGGAASTITLKAGAQPPDPCDVCYGYTGCPDFERYSYCDDYGRFYKCCVCGSVLYSEVCDDICIQQQYGCFNPAP